MQAFDSLGYYNSYASPAWEMGKFFPMRIRGILSAPRRASHNL